MRRDWLQTAIDAIRHNDHRNILAGAVAGLGAALAIGAMEWFSLTSNYPLVIAPVLAGALLLTAFAFAWHRWVRRGRGRSTGRGGAAKSQGRIVMTA
jgi:CBS-domain-containing membrane protein